MLFSLSSPEHSENSGCHFLGFCWVVPKFLVSWGDVLIWVIPPVWNDERWLEFDWNAAQLEVAAVFGLWRHFKTNLSDPVRIIANHSFCVMPFRMVGYAEVCSSASFLEGTVAVPRYSKAGTATFFFGSWAQWVNNEHRLARNERSKACSLLILAIGITLLFYSFQQAADTDGEREPELSP